MMISRESKFLNGVNYQLHYGFDFGEHPFIPRLGLDHQERLEKVRKDSALLDASGIHSVRMNVLTDGRGGIVYDSRGRPLGIQDSVFRGVENLLRVAEENHIVASLVMLDHKFAERTEWLDSEHPELGTKQGHSRLLMTASGREDLFNNILTPLLHEIGTTKSPSLLSVELINEPELLVQGLSTDTSMQNHLPSADLGQLKTFMRTFRDLVHRKTGAQFTVGSLAVRHAGIWLDVLDPSYDYLSIHYYGLNGDPSYPDLYRARRNTRSQRSVKGLQQLIPVVWGEYAANGASGFTNAEAPQSFSRADEFLEDALNNGVKGAYAWALRSGTGKWGDLFGPVPLEQHRLFAARHALRMEFIGAQPPVMSSASGDWSRQICKET